MLMTYDTKRTHNRMENNRTLEWYANLNPYNVIRCYYEYISFSDGESPSKAVYLANIDEKMGEEIFLNDTQALLRPTVTFIPHEAYEMVKTKLIEKLR